MTNDDGGEGGVTIPPKIDDVIYEQPLSISIGISVWYKYKLSISVWYTYKYIVKLWSKF